MKPVDWAPLTLRPLRATPHVVATGFIMRCHPADASDARRLLSITVRVAWRGALPLARPITAVIPLTLHPVSSHSEAPMSLKAVGLMDPGHPSELFGEARVPPGRYQLTCAHTAEGVRHWRFLVPENPRAPLRTFCGHGGARPSSIESAAALTPEGRTFVVGGINRFEPCCRERVLTPPGRRPPNQFALTLYTPLKGAVIFDVQGPEGTSRGHRWTVKAGSYVLVNPEETAAYAPTTTFPMHVRHLTLYQPLLRSFREAAGLPKSLGPFAFGPGPHPLSPPLAQAWTLLEQILSEEENARTRYHLQVAAHHLLLALLKIHPNRFSANGHRDPSGPIRSPQLRKVLAFIEDHYAESLTNDRLAQEADLTPDGLTKLFRRTLGRTPNDYLQSYRVEQAKRLLRDPSQTIEAIAQGVGYRDVRSFYRVFLRHAKAPTTSFRR